MDARLKAMLAGGGLALAVGVGGVASAGEAAAAAGPGGVRVACGGGGAELFLHPGARNGDLRKTHVNGDLDLGTCITHGRPSVTSGTFHLKAGAKVSCDSHRHTSGTVRHGHAGGFIRWDDGSHSKVNHGKLWGSLANLRLQHAKIVGGRYKGSTVEATLLFSENVIIRNDDCNEGGKRELDGRVMSFRVERR